MYGPENWPVVDQPTQRWRSSAVLYAVAIALLVGMVIGAKLL